MGGINITEVQKLNAINKLINENEVNEARKAILELINDCNPKDRLILSNCGRLMRNLGLRQDFVDKINEFGIENFIGDNYVLDAYTWCLYDLYIRSYHLSEDEESFLKFKEAANIIVTYIDQKPLGESYFNPFVATIKKYVNIVRRRASTNYHEVLKWINKLNTEQLSMTPQIKKEVDGEEKKYASDREFYYAIKSKALEKIKAYEESVQCCNEALQVFENEKLHHKNHIWFITRKSYCECKTHLNEKSINEYETLAQKYKFWYMFHRLSILYFDFGNYNMALIYSLKALLTDKINFEMMINLLYDIGLYLEANGNNDDAKAFYQCVGYNRKRLRWYLTEELRFKIKNFDINIEKAVYSSKLRDIAIKNLMSLESFYEGRVSFINESKNFGWIQYDSNRKMHFRFNIFKQKLKKDSRVIFKIGKQKDGRETVIEGYAI